MTGLLNDAADAANAVIRIGVNMAIKDILDLVRDIFAPLTKTRWGTKFIGVLAADGAVGYLAYLAMGKVTTDWPIVGVVGAAGICILGITVAYFKFRDKQEERETNGKTNGGDS